MPDGSRPKASGRSGRPDRLSSGIRGAIPYVAYSAFEIGWALSVAVARTMPSSSGRTRASNWRPIPAPWSSGSTNSIDRYHSRSRLIASANETTSSPPASSGRLATMNRSGSVDCRCVNSRMTEFISGGTSSCPSRTM